jgi:hypothetical protein
LEYGGPPQDGFAVANLTPLFASTSATEQQLLMAGSDEEMFVMFYELSSNHG